MWCLPENDRGICSRIEEQIKQQAKQQKIILKQTKRKSIRDRAISLEDIDKMED